MADLSMIPIGFSTDGIEIFDTEFSAPSLFDDLGIKNILGVSGFSSPDHFFSWVSEKSNVDLSEWEPIEINFYESWVENGLSCKKTWLYSPQNFVAGEVVCQKEKSVMAIRYKEFNDNDHIDIVRCKNQISSAVAKFKSMQPCAEISPENICPLIDYPLGVMLSIQNGNSHRFIDWPSLNLHQVFDRAELIQEEIGQEVFMHQRSFNWAWNEISKYSEAILDAYDQDPDSFDFIKICTNIKMTATQLRRSSSAENGLSAADGDSQEV